MAKKALFLLFFILLFIWGLWKIAFPEDVLQRWLEEKYPMSIDKMQKGPFFSLEGRGIGLFFNYEKKQISIPLSKIYLFPLWENILFKFTPALQLSVKGETPNTHLEAKILEDKSRIKISFKGEVEKAFLVRILTSFEDKRILQMLSLLKSDLKLKGEIEISRKEMYFKKCSLHSQDLKVEIKGEWRKRFKGEIKINSSLPLLKFALLRYQIKEGEYLIKI